MQKKHKRLGSGIDALLGTLEMDESENHSGIKQIDISKIVANENQPRQYFNTEKLGELANSIRMQGVLQPIIVEEYGEEFRIVAGERRFRASRLAGLKEVPVIIRNLSDEDRIIVALLENIQRENISPLEEATAYKDLMEVADLTQQELADKLGKNRSTVANLLRLLNLPSHMQGAINKGELTAGHARALLSITERDQQEKVFQEITQNKTSVRHVENRVQNIAKTQAPETKNNRYAAIETCIKEKIDLPVKIKPKAKGCVLEVVFHTDSDLKLLLNMLNINTNTHE
ncbi:MAG: ParB/RepB/Spo0J family partition protein [Spirochaetia bacterium]